MAPPGMPVSAEEIIRRSYEQKYLIEERIVLSLVEVINQGIRDQVSHGLLEYDFRVPYIIYGFPKFHVDYVAVKLRAMYQDKGFRVNGEGPVVNVTWERRTALGTETPAAPRLTSASTAIVTRPPPPAKRGEKKMVLPLPLR